MAGVGDVLKVTQERYRKDQPNPMESTVLGSFSVDAERNFHPDKSQRRSLQKEYRPDADEKLRIKLDLNAGIPKFTEYNGNTEESFECLLRWIIQNKEKLKKSGDSKRLSMDFVSVKTNLVKVMKSLMDHREWTMYAVEHKGTIYMKNWRKALETSGGQKSKMDNYEKWGHIFEAYVTGENVPEGVNPNVEFRCALLISYGRHSILYAPKVDCSDVDVPEEEPENLRNCLSVKCNQELVDWRSRRNYEQFGTLQWWAENTLTGIPSVLVGYRNDHGVVRTMEMLRTEDLPRDRAWNTTESLNFLDTFLAFVKDNLRGRPGGAIKIYRAAQGNIYCTPVDEDEQEALLPTWYKEELFP